MAKKKEKKIVDGLLRFNRVKPVTNVAISVLFIFLALLCFMPALLVLIVSFSSEKSVVTIGYSYFPLEWSIRVGDFIEADVRPESDPDVPLGRTMFKVTARGNSPSITIPKKWGMVQGDRVIVKVYRRIDDEDSGSPFERLDKRLFERGSVLI